jgi:ABC-type Fe3+ transport system substrate-binding protein
MPATWSTDLKKNTPISHLLFSNFQDHKLSIELRSKPPQERISRRKYDLRFKDGEGHWTVAFSNVAVAGYSTKQVKDTDVPQGWEDLLKPVWKGKMTLDSESYLWWAAVMEMLGKERGRRFMERLSQQNLGFRRGRTLQLQLLAAGEFALAIETHLRRLLEMKAQGAPLDYAAVQPFLKPSVLMIMKNALHPHAAMLFVDYVLSEEGQDELISPGIVSGNKEYKDQYLKLYKKLDFHMPDFIKIGKNFEEIARDFKKRFSP